MRRIVQGRSVMAIPAIREDTWVRTDWESFLALQSEPVYERSKFYYHHGWMRVEMSPVGPAHAEDNGLIAQVVGLFAFRCGLRFKSYVNVTLRKSGSQEAQPDLAYYLGNVAQLPPFPSRSNSPIDLDRYAPPSLTIEVAATSLKDDLTTKRALYGELGVQEYWVVDTQSGRVLMFGFSQPGDVATELERSRVLPGLSSVVLEEALHRGQAEGDGAAMQYILDL
ncbi:glr2673 [Gloeobacter violaceus PCC 7421]|uniref:Glr2673 protein n=2 Tax=Gloeobacter violaceus TaxID=33072 RepID=Q7NH64_GLOVI|nr:glr2673 [Gloeobacter violaceus PCC 7421]